MQADVIAIDGPAASGKSTVARRVAQALGYLYVDSGSLYRGVAWVVNRNGVNAGDPAALAKTAAETQFELFVRDGAVRFRIGGIEPGAQLRTEEVNAVVSPVAAVPEVRRKVVSLLRGMTRFGNLVIEGRDIGTAVFPGARAKFYLDASPEERARRRHAEDRGAPSAPSVADVRASIGRRDRIDSSRAMDPLKVAEGATIIDTTSLGIDEVVAKVLDRLGD